MAWPVPILLGDPVMERLPLVRWLTIGALTLSWGCATAPPTPSALGPSLPDPGYRQEYEVHPPDPGHGVARYIGLAIQEELSRSCGLMRTYFELDSSALSPQDRATLRAVAECLEGATLEGVDLSIVGRADSRGGTQYNADLGLRRAEAVKKILVGAGIAERRITISSIGAAGALGGDEARDTYSHGYDRRVDVVLLGVPHAPR